MFEALLAPIFFVVLALVTVVVVAVKVLRRRARGEGSAVDASPTRIDRRDHDTIDRRRTG